ncbi:ATP-dependent DNA ligase [Cellulomonas chengniuliangii]|uniref:ATP-dependent DNA ligase n=1 Tax=Cellulomonas chengniuliangii TaxID=2968084 RepID=UPI001D0E4922|nr:ATP-dependent DNA ligase [Cellulomonas chengniuliangii]MCC2319510.1 ATP-dependent DNA ligase [Cellulomonas chengniuliangii]
MDLPVMPPVDPMLAKSVPAIPSGELYEPKWDGFRAIVFRDGDEVEIGSRNTRPMQRYFPDIVEAALAHLPERCVVDGEIVLPSATTGGLDWDALQQRIHPAASRVRLLARETPALLILFDLLALDDADLTGTPFAERRARLEQIISPNPQVYVTAQTDDQAVAADWFQSFEGAGLDGVVAKSADLLYQPGKRVMAKVKHERTADCVIAGYRPHKSGDDAVGSLLLGLYTSEGVLTSVGVAAAFSMARRRELVTELAPLVTSLDDHPWNDDASGRTPRESEQSRWSAGKDLSFIPLRPELVVEVGYDHLEGDRFRHVAQFRRWRPDRDPSSCTYEQLEEPVTYALADVLAAGV